MGSVKQDNFFSVGLPFIIEGIPMPYDLYINSSAPDATIHFVRIFPSGQSISAEIKREFISKYKQLYILEKQRGVYLKSLTASSTLKDEQKVDVIKDSAIQYLSKLFDPDTEFTTEILEEAVTGCRDSVEGMVEAISDYSIDDIQSLIAKLSYHDFYTYDHSINVSMYAMALFRAYKKDATREEIVASGMAGLLHDLGKMNISTAIINNAGKLSDEDFEEIKKHPGFGKDLLAHQCEHCKGLENLDLESISRAVYEHHENFNGTGYPRKIDGSQIHLFARIVAISDFFDAITTKRSYHEVLKTDEALVVMERSVGKKLDPELFEVFKNTVSDFQRKDVMFELPDDFDPCRPQYDLPFEKVKPTKLKSQEEIFAEKNINFGKVNNKK